MLARFQIRAAAVAMLAMLLAAAVFGVAEIYGVMEPLNMTMLPTKMTAAPRLAVGGADGVAIGPGDRSLRFDRILCDVPCSGDGTLRKAPDLWTTLWAPRDEAAPLLLLGSSSLGALHLPMRVQHRTAHVQLKIQLC